MIENGFVYLPDTAPWLAPYLHELSSFPNGRRDDQVDSTAQMLDWFKRGSGRSSNAGIFEYYECWPRRRADSRPSASVGCDRAPRTVIADGQEARHPPAVVTARQGREPNAATA